MNPIKHIRTQSQKREILFEQWRYMLFTGKFDEANKLYKEMKVISDDVKSIIGRRPRSIEFTNWSKMKHGDFFTVQLESEIQNRKETITQ